MKTKDNNYYRDLYIRLLKIHDIKKNIHRPDEWYTHVNNSEVIYKNIIYNLFDREYNISNFGFHFKSEEELLINLDLRGI